MIDDDVEDGALVAFAIEIHRIGGVPYGNRRQVVRGGVERMCLLDTAVARTRGLFRLVESPAAERRVVDAVD